MTDPLRRVVAVYRGGADDVLFECGHRCVLPVARGRDYPKRRRCFNCRGGHQQPWTLTRWLEREGPSPMIQIIDASATWPTTEGATHAAE